ncbi:MAG: ThiF family adenylyltransferase [Candidatus Woesearchaeota archaeon]
MNIKKFFSGRLKSDAAYDLIQKENCEYSPNSVQHLSLEQALRDCLIGIKQDDNLSLVFDRQAKISGWKQDALLKSSVAIFGSSPASNYLAAGLSALGVGRIYLIPESAKAPSSQEFLSRLGSRSMPSGDGLEYWLNCRFQKSPQCRVYLLRSASELFAFSIPDIVLDASHNLEAKLDALDFSASLSVPLLSVSFNGYSSLVSAVFTGGASDFSGRGYSGIYYLKEADARNSNYFNGFNMAACGVASGIVLDIVRKFLMPLSQDVFPELPFYYSLISGISYGESALKSAYEDFCGLEGISEKMVASQKLRCLLVGAGALGNFAALALCLSGISVDIADFDSVELTNANRQILISDRDSIAFGRNKAEVLSERLRELGADCTFIRGIVSKGGVPEGYALIDKTFVQKNEYGCILGCVDNPPARALLNEIAVHQRIPFFDSGTEPFSGSLRCYIPDMSPCLDCQVGIYELARIWEERTLQRDSCSLSEKEPSVVISNMLLGSALGGELLRFLILQESFLPLLYDSSNLHPLLFSGVTPAPSKSCSCTSKTD